MGSLRERLRLAKLVSGKMVKTSNSGSKLKKSKSEQKQPMRMRRGVSDQFMGLDKKGSSLKKSEKELNQKITDVDLGVPSELFELLSPQSTFDDECNSLQAWLDEKLKRKLSVERESLDKQRKNFQQDAVTLKLLQLKFKETQTEFEKRQRNSEREI